MFINEEKKYIVKVYSFLKVEISENNRLRSVKLRVLIKLIQVLFKKIKKEGSMKVFKKYNYFGVFYFSEKEIEVVVFLFLGICYILVY